MTEEISLGARLRELAAESPTAVVCTLVSSGAADRDLTAAELDRRSDQLAGAMAAKGVGVGHRVAIALRNSLELVISTCATWKLGATPVPVRWDLPDWELDALKEVIDAQLHLSDDDLAWIRSTVDAEVPELQEVTPPRMMGICSSGSTGTPKIIVSQAPGTHVALKSSPMMELFRPVARPQVVMVLAPMYHVNGFITQLNLLAGDRLVVLERFDAAAAVDAIERHRVTTFTATPAMLQRIVDLPDVDRRDLSSLDWFLQGAAPMPPSLVHRLVDLVGAGTILMAYGMTEALGVVAITGEEWLHHQGSVGRGLRGTEIRVLREDGTEAPIGEVGDIYLRSTAYPGSQYLGDVPQVVPTEDGFRSVGDMGHLDADGYLYIADRRVDMIVSGGANVFPAQVEAALVDHPKIADVVVIGLRDDTWGRRVHAIVEPADADDPPTAAEVIAYAKERLAAYKVPKTVELVEDMPRSAATKVNRGRLVEERGG